MGKENPTSRDLMGRVKSVFLKNISGFRNISVFHTLNIQYLQLLGM